MFRFHEVRENPERSLFDAGYRVLRNETRSNHTVVTEPEHSLEENLAKCKEIINAGMASIPVEEIDSHCITDEVTDAAEDEIDTMSSIMDTDDRNEFAVLVKILRRRNDPTGRNTIRRKERLKTIIKFYYKSMTDEEIEELIEKL